jgi:hypothetical protein
MNEDDILRFDDCQGLIEMLYTIMWLGEYYVVCLRVDDHVDSVVRCCNIFCRGFFSELWTRVNEIVEEEEQGKRDTHVQHVVLFCFSGTSI